MVHIKLFYIVAFLSVAWARVDLEEDSDLTGCSV
jgi:hypothetical protein